MTVAAVFLCFLWFFRFKQKKQKNQLLSVRGIGIRKDLFRKEVIFFGILFIFITWIMFYVFFIKDGVLYSGFTVFGDYAPHTAMIRSFSWGTNFPTQYPHFGGEDVKYHFMFQFLAGNLEYLGMRLDIAYNSISILSLLGLLIVLYQIAMRITGKFFSSVLAVLLFFFRSGWSFFQFVWEHIQTGDLWQTLQNNTAFIGYTPNENWGLWNFNVYLNQRHFAFGLLMASVFIWVYLEWLEAGDAHEEKGFLWVKGRFFSVEAWKCRNPETALLIGVILGLCAFWNGAAVIGCLLILMGFAVFSDGKLDYVITAAFTVLFSSLQSSVFVDGQLMSPSFYFGFLAEKKTLAGIIQYLFTMSGITFLGLIVLFVFWKRKERMIALGFLLPTVFSFFVSLTPDINVNHKYIMISCAFLTILWGQAIGNLFGKKIRGKAVAAVLTVFLTVTGIYDFVVILKDNDSHHRVSVNLNSSLSLWLAENLTSDDLILTPEYSINEVTMSGVMLYCGWPYYAWSAGYDTGYRAQKAVEIYTTDDAAVLRETVEQEGITYILFEEGMEFEQQNCREDVIRDTYPLVYTSEDGRIRIYET
jgi:hypothetical protein